MREEREGCVKVVKHVFGSDMFRLKTAYRFREERKRIIVAGGLSTGRAGGPDARSKIR
jgi:hypothetical protein